MKSSIWDKLHSLLEEVLSHEKAESAEGQDESADIKELEEALSLCNEYRSGMHDSEDMSEAPEEDLGKKGRKGMVVSVGLHEMPLQDLENHVRKMSQDAGRGE